MYRRILNSLLCLLLIITLIPSEVGAAGAGGGNDGTSGTGQLGLNFLKKTGILHYEALNKTASSGIRFQSVGWILRADATCDSKNKLKAQCTPLQDNNYVRLEFDELEKLGKMVKDDKVDKKTGKTLTVYDMDGVYIQKLMSEKPALKNIKEGEPLFFSALFKVKIDNKLQPTIYTTLDGIRNAKTWASPGDFRQYYDQKVYFNGTAPLKIRLVNARTGNLFDNSEDIVTVDNSNLVVESNQIKASTVRIKNKDEEETEDWRIQPTSTQVKIPKTYVFKGKTYKLKCSYQQNINSTEKLDCKTASKQNPNFLRDGETLTRQPGMDVGGVWLTLVYEEADVKCNCSTTLTIPNSSTIAGEVTGDTIGKQVPITINMKQSDTALKDWKLALEGKSNVKVKVNVTRTGGSGNPTLTGTPTSGTEKTMDATDLIKYFDGTTPLTYTDNLSSYPIAEDQKVEFEYNATVTVTYIDGNANTVFVTCENSTGTKIKFFRKKKDDPNRFGYYTSRPSYWSEIKEGTPGNETFDAMAGTPTTRSLYFATGGSEFIVDIETEYVSDATATRTYTSKFNAVPSGWNMSPITGSIGHESPPPQPTPRTKTDVSGASYTERVSSHSTKHVTKPAVPCSGNPCTGGSPEESHTDYWWVQEGYNKTVGGYSDTWTQTVTFDYTKINKVHVWKIDKSKVNGMAELTKTNEITASVVQGDPTIFANIAASNTSAAGRLRYSLEANQHDNVVWNEGNSDNRDANSPDDNYGVSETARFKERRALTTNVTAVSDFLILQTSSGDQSVMYFDKESNTAKTTDPLIVPKTSKVAQWDSNSNSAAKWSPDAINIGSYNGKYGSPTLKYIGSGSGTRVQTVFDRLPAGLNRPARPGGPLRLMQTGINPIRDNPNGLYVTGNSTVFYRSILDKGSNETPYSNANDPKYGANGQSFTSAYSPTHSKVNDVVLHDPVSTEKAIVIPLKEERDQRTNDSKLLGGNLQQSITEYEKKLKPDYRQNLIPNGDAELLDFDGQVTGWQTWTEAKPEDITFTHRSGDQWVIGGSSSFEISTKTKAKAGKDIKGVYYRDVSVKPGKRYQFTGDLGCHRCKGNFYIDARTASGTIVNSFGSEVVTGVAKTGIKIDFTMPTSASIARIHIVKGETNGSDGSMNDYLFADNLKLTNQSDNEWVGLDPVYQRIEVSDPNYKPPVTGMTKTFTSLGANTFDVPATGTYTLEAWGAEGGTSGYGGKGGYAKGTITLNAGETLTVMVGGQTGTNGGGSGHGRSTDSGGGASDIRKGGTALSNRILVAGGGGGYGGGSTKGGDGGGLTGSTGEKKYGTPGQGGTQSSGGTGGDNNGGSGSLGNGGSNTAGANSGGGGGGGGYYGGGAGGNDYPSYDDMDDSGGGGGSSYIGGVQGGTTTAGMNSGNGKVVITIPDSPGTGAPTRVEKVMLNLGGAEPPPDAYEYIPKVSDPEKEVDVPGLGKFKPGNFINLDYGFSIYFPNNGDFYGNGAWGISSPSAIEGKGFVNNMDTTEWTKSKAVRFEYPVIYKDQMYLQNEWIDLPVSESNFDFYVPLAAKEKISALVEFRAIAINGEEDNEVPINKVRYNNLAARHSAIKRFNIDVVGNIGNLVIEDTGDFRFSNLFKEPVSSNQWFIPNLVKKVNPNKQNKIVGDTIDIRGKGASAETHYLNTYGLLPHKQQMPIELPLSPEKNNITALQKQPMRLGYNVLADVETTGNYYANLQIIPYYYQLNLQTGKYTPVDVYMLVNGEYKPINKFDIVKPGWDNKSVYPYTYSLKWVEESGRRNYSKAEEDNTDAVTYYSQMRDTDTGAGKTSQPSGMNYPFGTAQISSLTGRNRTYIGSENTYGYFKNPGYKMDTEEFGMQAQRWHFTYGLPSSAVVVAKGKPITKGNIEDLRNNTSVLVMAADIKAIGEVYALQYKVPGGNNEIKISGTRYSTTSIPYSVINVFSGNKSSADDLEISGTH
ncbi:glycine-rich protein [Paenibacillus popilliae]|uniref:receptor protein-tyrosine kinase n=1 Tax=Paenibacillus popilliae TaxID=78057 RepID=A0ABY3AP14_PAEPP|nr:glycine-rich protein [Paenibacillus sp. SDF0028]TQR44228.1 hypothetical protein C7Y44_13795 [Paenibacillus sp. SDF0028]